jgi:hypothetical protein
MTFVTVRTGLPRSEPSSTGSATRTYRLRAASVGGAAPAAGAAAAAVLARRRKGGLAVRRVLRALRRRVALRDRVRAFTCAERTRAAAARGRGLAGRRVPPAFFVVFVAAVALTLRLAGLTFCLAGLTLCLAGFW